jgi:hypothetical protein
LKLHAFILSAFSIAAAADQPALAPDAIVQSYCAAQQQAQPAKASRMDMDIQASLPGLKKQGRLHGLRKITVLAASAMPS